MSSRRFTGGSEEQVSGTVFRKLMAEGRYLQDIFAPPQKRQCQEGPTLQYLRDLVLHNNAANGHLDGYQRRSLRLP